MHCLDNRCQAMFWKPIVKPNSVITIDVVSSGKVGPIVFWIIFHVPLSGILCQVIVCIFIMYSLLDFLYVVSSVVQSSPTPSDLNMTLTVKLGPAH